VSLPVNVMAADHISAIRSMPDIEVASAPARPANSFDELFAAHYQRLVRALTVVAGDAESAADAVQEAFVKAHLRWRKVGGYDDPIGWVRRVAINQLRDGHRRSSRKERALARLATLQHTTTVQPEIDEFDRLLTALPKQQRAITALFYVDGLSVSEIAASLELSDGTVKSHLYDARQRLRPVLEREHRNAAGPPPPPPPSTSTWERP
jgi:RNA polymerase sigma-70 factor (ECF subfamily)